MDRNSNIDAALKLLRKEHKLISSVIECLGALKDAPPAPQKSTRGRKFMGTAERKEVSERMSRYWASRRTAKGAQS